MPVGKRKLTETEVQKLLDCGKSPRSRELERLQAYYDGTQYQGRVPYLDLASNVPRLERAPCVVYPLAKAAIESNVALAMGGQRFPQILSMSSEDDSSFDPRFGLSPDDSGVLDQFNTKLIDTCGFQSAFRQAMRMAQASRSVALIVCYRNGLPAIDPVWSKLCTPTFDPKDPTRLQSLEIRYRYIEYYQDALVTQGEWWPIVKEYRRIIDDKADTVFTPKEVWLETDVSPSAAVQDRVPHGLGFCPVVWYARQRQSYAVGGFDGCAVHDGHVTELDAINHALSSRHLAAMYTGDPIVFASGVDPDESLGTTGRTARPDGPLGQAAATEWDRAMFGQRSGPAIRKGPGEMWRVASPDAKLGYITLPPGALDALDSHAQDLCSKTREALRYVWIDPEKLTGSGDISGKTLAFVFGTQVNAISEDREDFGRNCLLPTLGVVYRMLVKTTDDAGVFVPGLKKAKGILQRFLVKLADGTDVFMAPQLKPKWGEFFEPSDVDEATRSGTAIQAKTAGLITLATAVEHIKPIFAISNVEQYIESLQQETQQNDARELDKADAMATIQAKAKGDGAPGGGGASSSKSTITGAKPATPDRTKRGLEKRKQ